MNYKINVINKAILTKMEVEYIIIRIKLKVLLKTQIIIILMNQIY